MAYPTDLVLVRHGHSLGNQARTKLGEGDDSMVTILRSMERSAYPLTDLGMRQAQSTGKWLRQEFGDHFFQTALASSMVRAVETAHYLLPDADWEYLDCLEERNWGNLDLLSPSERQERFGENLALRESNPYSWKPPRGECLEIDVSRRIGPVLEDIQNGKYSHGPCIVVTHHDILWAMRYLIEGMTLGTFRELHLSKDEHVHINNADVLHYTRRNPNIGEVDEDRMWLRHIRAAETPVWISPWMEFVPAPALSIP